MSEETIDPKAEQLASELTRLETATQLIGPALLHLREQYPGHLASAAPQLRQLATDLDVAAAAARLLLAGLATNGS